jgi:hypothetical protein
MAMISSMTSAGIAPAGKPGMTRPCDLSDRRMRPDQHRYQQQAAKEQQQREPLEAAKISSAGSGMMGGQMGPGMMAAGTCEIVEGPINPMGWCILYPAAPGLNRSNKPPQQIRPHDFNHGGGDDRDSLVGIGTRTRFSMLSFCKLAVIGAALVFAGASTAAGQDASSHPAMGSGRMSGVSRQHQGVTPMDGHSGIDAETTVPTLPGQDAFGAIQEIVRLLEADPKTDWSKVDLEALRQHLIDMNEVTLDAAAAAKAAPGGIRVAVTGSGRTIAAVKRMVPDQAAMIEAVHPNGWSARTEPLPNGMILIVTAKDPKQIEIIRGLGFIGVLASGDYHRMHHLAMAKGAFRHMH